MPQRNYHKSEQKKTGTGKMLLFCGITAALLLTICTKSSFLYPLNDWVDANIYFTMGKGMMRGRVLYRDIYDHKGPLLYFIHGIASLISYRSFFGVYLIEIISFTAFLAGVWKLGELYCKKQTIWMIPVMGALILASDSFCHGDSAEELCLPLLMWSLYVSVRYFKEEYPEPMGYGTLFANGILAGCILWIKYTMLGFHFAWMMMIFVSCILRRDYKRSIVSCFVFLGGMLATAVPWLIYFGVNGALWDLWKGYVYDNVFLYGNSNPAGVFQVIKSLVKNVLDAFVANWKFSPFIVGGMLWFWGSGKQSLLEKVNLLALAVFTALGVCWGVVQWQPYYALVFSVFSVFGAVALLQALQRVWPGKREASGMSFAVLLAAGMIFCYLTGNYTEQIGTDRESLVQYQFAAYVEETENASILNYGFLDGGFYTACGITPQFTFFTTANIMLPELYGEQEDIVQNGKVDYVITRGFELKDEQLNHYEELASQTADYEGIRYTYYLYKNRRLQE